MSNPMGSETQGTLGCGSATNRRKRVRGLTKNEALAKKREKGEAIDIGFAFGKVCGKDASTLKSEITICIRQHAPLKVKSWRFISDIDKDVIWTVLKEKLNISEDMKHMVMHQVSEQYNNRVYRLHVAYRGKKDRPEDVDEVDWRWLIENKWETEAFKGVSAKNASNKAKVEVGSSTGTRSIVQTAYDMKQKSESKTWPSAVDLWKATHKKKDEGSSTPIEDAIVNNLEELGQTHADVITASTQPLVEHFSLALGKKVGYLRGMGIQNISSSKLERQKIHEKAEAAKKHAQSLEQEVDSLRTKALEHEELNRKLQAEIEEQRALIESQNVEHELARANQQREIGEMIKQQLALYIPHLNNDS